MTDAPETRFAWPAESYRSAIAMSTRLAKAIAHPLRVRILIELSRSGEIGPTRFKDTTGAAESVQIIAKHFRYLEELGFIEETRKRRSGRSVECVFSPVRTRLFDDAAWTTLIAGQQSGLTERGFTSQIERLRQSIEAGTFEGRGDRVFKWASFTYDEIAWEQMAEAIEALFWCSVDDWEKAKLRLADSGEESIPVTMGLSFIEAPPSVRALDQLQNAPFFLEEDGQLFFDQNLAAGLTHGLRLLILGALRSGPMSPKAFHDEFGERLGLRLAKVAQQFRRLEELDCIEVVAERRGRRGRPEKVYGLTQRSLYDGSRWEVLPSSLQAEVSALTITTYIEAFAESVASGAADRRPTSHSSWVGMRVDERAWGDLVARMAAFSRFAAALHEESVKRSKGGDHVVPVLVSLAAFESPRGMGVSPAATLQKLERDLLPDRDRYGTVLGRIVEGWSRRPSDELRKTK